MQSEKLIENSIKRHLDGLGGFYVKTHGNMFSSSGTPDILACINGRFVAIEVKRPGGRVSALQQAKINLIRDAGGIAFVAYSLEETKQNLEKFNLI